MKKAAREEDTQRTLEELADLGRATQAAADGERDGGDGHIWAIISRSLDVVMSSSE